MCFIPFFQDFWELLCISRSILKSNFSISLIICFSCFIKNYSEFIQRFSDFPNFFNHFYWTIFILNNSSSPKLYIPVCRELFNNFQYSWKINYMIFVKFWIILKKGHIVFFVFVMLNLVISFTSYIFPICYNYIALIYIFCGVSKLISW